jgi:hypothetical protein
MPHALAQAATCSCEDAKPFAGTPLALVALALLPWAAFHGLRFIIYRWRSWWARCAHLAALASFVARAAATGLGRGIRRLPGMLAPLAGWIFQRLVGRAHQGAWRRSPEEQARSRTGTAPEDDTPEEARLAQRRRAWMRARQAFLHRMHNRPTPLFAVAVERPLPADQDAGPQRRPSRTPPRSQLIPYGIGARSLPVGASVGALAVLSVLHALGAEAGELFWGGGLVLGMLLGCTLSVATLMPVLLGPESGPIDDLIRHSPEGERPALMEGAGLLDVVSDRRSRLGSPRLWQVAVGLVAGLQPMHLRPPRLQSLAMFRRHNFQRVILCLGLARVLLGRGGGAAPPAGPLGNRSFVALYFGHSLALYALLVVAMLFASFAGGEAREDAFRVLAVGLFFWWGSVVGHALGAVHREMAMLREDLREFPAFLPATIERENAISALVDLLTAAQSRWMPGLVSASSTVMLIAALTIMQVLGAD